MWDFLQSAAVHDGVTTGLAWLITGSLLAVGLLGCFLPVLPGHLLLFLAAVAHRLLLGAEDSGLRWWSFLVLGLLMAASQGLEMLSGAAGAKWFGGTRWGALGALAGGVIGMFFFPIGLLAGPLLGCVLAEIAWARRHPRQALVSGVGSVVGTLAGMAIKLVIGLLMIGWFLLDVLLIG